MSASKLEYFGSQRKANNVKPGVQILTLEITTLKIQSDCFSIKRSRKRPTDCSFQLTFPIYYHTRRWNVIKDSKFQPSLVDRKVFKMWVLLGTSYPVQYSGLHFAGVEDFNIHSGKSWNIHDLVVGHWTLCDGKTNWNHENKCFYVENSLLSHCKSEKSCQITK